MRPAGQELLMVEQAALAAQPVYAKSPASVAQVATAVPECVAVAQGRSGSVAVWARVTEDELEDRVE